MRLEPLAFSLLLACAAPGMAEPQEPVTTTPDASAFRPIRFGDAPAFALGGPFFAGATYDPAHLDPADLLGQPVGSRLARHHEVVAAWRSWAESSPRLDLSVYGRTYEGRPLLRAVITSEANHAKLDELTRDVRRLWDPRGLPEAEGARLVEELPAVAWMGYSVHGDELSGVDAALALGHHLVASTDGDVADLLEDLVIVVDPCMNPDGRERIVSQIEQSFGYVQNLDYASMHRGRWPGGRGNHYLFDMNRDWMAGVAPETRGRWAAVLELPPQLFVDAHEMSGLDTFLFYPHALPHNPEMAGHVKRWQGVMADDAGAAFDAFRWGYYTREWADGWAPFYSDSFGTLQAAIGMLYEQGSADGQALRRESGEVVSYRETVHGQLVASWANLDTLRRNRAAILEGYLAERRANVSADQREADRMWVARPDGSGRLERLARTLAAQGIEVERLTAAASLGAATDTFGRDHEALELPAGSLAVRVRQPQAAMVRAYLGFDPRMSREALEKERRRLERGEGSGMYDVTAWDLGRTFDLDCYWTGAIALEAEPVDAATDAPWPGTHGYAAGTVAQPDLSLLTAATALAVDGASDRVPAFAAAALERGLVLHVATEPFRGAGRAFGVGSLLLRVHENERGARRATHDELDGSGETPGQLERRRIAETAAAVAARTGVELVPLGTQRSPDEGPDLGGGAFELLVPPRVAIVSGEGVDRSSFGHVWRYLDEELGLKASLLEAGSLGFYDLRRFNVLVLPPGAGRALSDAADSIEQWVEAGGTLVALGSSAGSLTSTDLSRVVRRRAALDELDTFAWLVDRERAARGPSVDPAVLYDGAVPAAEDARGSGDGSGEAGVAAAEEASGEPSGGSPDLTGGAPDPEAADRWQRRFAPSGVILRAERDVEHWLNGGARADELPVLVSGSTALLAPEGVSVPVRLGAAGDLRLGGLLWPEAEARLADAAWATVERRGAGQVVLFAASPVFRGSWPGTARLLANALVIGPGAGTDQPMGL